MKHKKCDTHWRTCKASCEGLQMLSISMHFIPIYLYISVPKTLVPSAFLASTICISCLWNLRGWEAWRKSVLEIIMKILKFLSSWNRWWDLKSSYWLCIFPCVHVFPVYALKCQSMKNRQHDPLNMLKREASLRWSANLKLLHNGHLARQYLLSRASLSAFLVEVGQPVATVNCKSFTSMWHSANQLWPSDLEMNPAGWTLRHVRRPSSGHTSIAKADPHLKKAFHLKQILAI